MTGEGEGNRTKNVIVQALKTKKLDENLAHRKFITRLFTVPYFFVRWFRYTASYRHGYLDFQMYRGDRRRGL